MGAGVRFLHKPAVQFQLSVFGMAESSSVGEVRRILVVAASIPFQSSIPTMSSEVSLPMSIPLSPMSIPRPCIHTRPCSLYRWWM